MAKFFFILITVLLFSANIAFANESNCVKYNKENYNLVFSAKSSEHAGYYNQYLKNGETDKNWTEMIALHHFPNVYSPIDLAHTFREYLAQNKCPSALYINDDDNTCILDFLLIDDGTGNKKHMIILEFNVFKYVKAKNCGTVAFQYAKRYQITNANQVDGVKKQFEKYRPKALKTIQKFELPDVIEEDFGNMQLNNSP